MSDLFQMIDKLTSFRGTGNEYELGEGKGLL